jgi:hypothetical protein
MAFTASKAFVGIPDFKVVDINAEEVARCLQGYVERGSKLTGISLDDISLSVVKLPNNPNTVNLIDILEIGMKLFDALVWLTAGRPENYPLTEDPTMASDKIPGLHDIAKAVFYVYFFLVTQARYPASSKTKETPKVPNFLSVVMGLTDPQNEYIEKLCSFNPVGFDAKWAQHVSFKGLGQETLSRFGLGVAGYRLFGPFKLYNVKEGLSDELIAATKFAQKVAISEPTWGIHPLTRDPSVLTKRGNLNKNLGNLILDCFTDAQISEMVTAKILFNIPKREPSYRNYLQWTESDDISGAKKIFN